MPKIVALCGTVKGASATDTPLTSTRLNTLAPTTLPNDRSLWPLMSEVMAVTSSGRDVPSATKVSAITLSGTPKAWAIRVPLSTSRLAPMAISTAPSTSSINIRGRGMVSSSSSCSSAGAFFIWWMLAAM